MFLLSVSLCSLSKTVKTLNTAKTHLSGRMKNFVKMAKVFKCLKRERNFVKKKAFYNLEEDFLLVG